MMNDPEPLEFRNVLISPGRDFLGLSLTFKEDRPGLLREISGIIEDAGLSINYIYGYSVGAEPRMILVVDITDKEVDARELVERISGVRGIGEVRVFEPVTRGLIADTTSFPPTVFGERIVMLRKSALKELIRGLIETIGPRAASGILYQVGVRMGRGLSRKHVSLSEELGIGDPFGVVEKVALPLFQSLGYGIAEVERKGEDIVVRKYECIECTSLKEILEENPNLVKSSEDVGCSMVRGIIEGAVSEIMGIEYESREEKCVARGDEYCELVLTPRR